MSESLKLTGQQQRILREGILGTYPEPDALKILLSDEMEVEIGIIAQGDVYITKVFNLIKEFQADGRIEKFIRVIVQDKPNSPYINDIIKNFPSLFSQVSPPPEENPKIKQFREKVKEYLSDRILEDKERALLVIQRKKLGLSAGEADKVVEEELALIQQAQQAYKDMLEDLIEFYPFDESIQKELKEFQLDHNLTDEEVEKISQPILEEAEINYQRKCQQEIRSLYEKRFTVAIDAGYPLDDFVRNNLKNLQESLHLSDEDIERIEEPIVASKKAAYQQRLAEEQRQKKEKEEKAKELRQQQEAFEQQQQQEETKKRQEEEQNFSLQRFEFDVITVDKKGEENSRTRKSASFFIEDLGNGIGLEMVYIPAGTYLMGSPEGKGNADERPQHRVTVPSYLMGKYPITQAQWRIVAAYPPEARELNPNPANFRGDNRPVEQVSWEDATEFCSRLSKKTGREYRLPSEAKWEYACRAGTTTDFYFGDTLTPKLARCKSNLGMALLTIFSGETAPVGSYPPNAFGLYDMHGNVSEWCEDDWHSNYEGYEGNPPVDGSAWKSNEDSAKILRGGSWNDNSALCRSAIRFCYGRDDRLNDLGFRVVCEVGRTF
jgi:formylglycine-generating enzyme required for sulfatase activity